MPCSSQVAEIRFRTLHNKLYKEYKEYKETDN